MNCLECVKLEKRLRIQLSDHEFELRKLSEDKSTEKALYEINLQKEVRRWQERYHKEKQDHEENGKKWLAKIDSVNEQHAATAQELHRHAEAAIAREKQRMEAELQNYRQTTERAYEDRLNEMRQKYQAELEERAASHAGELERVRREQAGEVERLQGRFGEKEGKMRSEYESQLLGLRSEKNAEEKTHSRLQEEFKRERSRFITELYELRTRVGELEGSVRELQATVGLKEQELQSRAEEMASVKVAQAGCLRELEANHVRMLEQLEERNENRIRQFYENQLQITEKYEQTILKIEENREIELRLYQNKMNEIKNCVESRPSRLEDVEEILSLKERLARREREFETLEREVKTYQLELENKEDTYNKIFIPTINSTHLSGESGVIKRKELKIKRAAGKSVSTVREILNSVNVNSNNLPLLNNLDKKCLPPRSTKIL